MTISYRTLLFAAFGAIAVIAGPAGAADGDFDLGLRGIIVTAGGEPANDMMGYSLLGRYHFNDRWAVGFSIESLGFDSERPYEFIGIVGDPTYPDVDSTTELVSFNAWIEGVYPRPSGRLEWFWTAGLGLGSGDADDITGPTADGGTYDLTIDVGTEFNLSASGGLRFFMGEHWALEAVLRADQHFTDWKILDHESGREGTIDDYLAWGASIGVAYRF